MKQSEMQQVATRLGELSEFYDRKPPTANALKVWADALSGCTLADVMDALTDWPRSKRTFPIASEVVEACRALNLQRHQALTKRVDEPMAALSRGDPSSPAYRDFKAWAAEFKRHPPPCPNPDRIGTFVRVGALLMNVAQDFEPNPDHWWKTIITRWRDGGKLLVIQQQMATQAWINAGRPADWTPPDIEAQLERAAIQAEDLPY
jgi:hypothetical protein